MTSSSRQSRATWRCGDQKQFGTVGPASGGRLEIGLNLKGDRAGRPARTTHRDVHPPGPHERPGRVDAEVIGWLREAYDRGLRSSGSAWSRWAGSSAVEHGTFNPLVEGSNPSRLTMNLRSSRSTNTSPASACSSPRDLEIDVRRGRALPNDQLCVEFDARGSEPLRRSRVAVPIELQSRPFPGAVGGSSSVAGSSTAPSADRRSQRRSGPRGCAAQLLRRLVDPQGLLVIPGEDRRRAVREPQERPWRGDVLPRTRKSPKRTSWESTAILDVVERGAIPVDARAGAEDLLWTADRRDASVPKGDEVPGSGKAAIPVRHADRRNARRRVAGRIDHDERDVPSSQL